MTRGQQTEVRTIAAAEEFRSTITPVLTIRDAAQAMAFYGRAFGAEEISRNTYPGGRVVGEMVVEGARFRVADEAPEASNLSPQTLNGTTVRINLPVADPDELAARAVANGAMEVAPVADHQSYGLRQGRFADPFGHHWLIGRPLAGTGRRLGAQARALAPGDRQNDRRQADSSMGRHARSLIGVMQIRSSSRRLARGRDVRRSSSSVSPS